MNNAAVRSILVAVVLLAVAVIAEAQQPKKIPRIGYVSGTGERLSTSTLAKDF
jgi:hypothetical protein